MMLEYFGCDSKSTLVNRAHDLSNGPGLRTSQRLQWRTIGSMMIYVWGPWVSDPWINKELTSKHEMVRILNFQNGTRWIAGFRIPSRDNHDFEASKRVLQQEVDCMQLLKERTSVLVPTVFGYIASHENDIGGSFILMECLSGNAAVNL